MRYGKIFRPSLNKKLVLIMLLLNLSLTALIIFIYYGTEKALYNEFERRTADVLRAVQIGIEEATSGGISDEKKLEAYLESLKFKGVTEISVISTSDKIISSTNPGDVGKWITRNKKELIVKADLGEPVTGEGQTYFVMIPVVIGDQQAGYIHLRVNTEDFSIFLRHSLIRRIIAASAIFGFGMIIAVILASRYTRPIRKAVEAANRIAGGDLDVSLETGRNDEIGELARSFNFMIAKLKEEKDLREHLRRTEHLATIGELAQSVAHEIKNPLNFISLSADHLRESYPCADPAKAGSYDSLLENMKSEIQRVSRFLQSFLELGKPLELKLRQTDIKAMVSQAFELVSARAGREKVKLTEEYECSPSINADPELLKTCVYNIILNSLQSMPDGGALTAKVSCSDGTVEMRFEDTGKGVPETELGKVFAPYFTTKSDGLGLGLALTKRIVEEHGGKIYFKSIAGKGSMVTISLPPDETDGGTA